ncbi:hypothetical protein RIF29_04209 [Crotalaria pallida]|uniref:Uncharacterized protein n=1 Tax=Crotalaria pallida TaxID=3830 RepID=A0AAN9PA94_CROPI
MRMSSARVCEEERENEDPSVQEDDLKKHSSKKVKVGDESSSPMDEDHSSVTKGMQNSCKETLLKDSSSSQSWDVLEIDDEELLENKWYKEAEEEVETTNNNSGVAAIGAEMVIEKSSDKERSTGSKDSDRSSTVISQDKIIIGYDSGNKSEENKEQSLRKEIILETSHFGPWMLARKPTHFKGNLKLKQERESTQSRERGSRFVSLSEDMELVNEFSMELPTASKKEQLQDDNLIKKQASTSKKTNKVRSLQGGKNPQIKNKQTTKGPILPSHKESTPKPTSVEVVTKSPKFVSDDEKRIMRGKEQVILHKMWTLKRQGYSGIDNIATYVVLPNEESVDFNLIQRGKNIVINPAPKPLIQEKTMAAARR